MRSFWLSGTTADVTLSLTVSGYVNKKGNGIAGSAIQYASQSAEEITFSLKK